jgi:hypothetical protein
MTRHDLASKTLIVIQSAETTFTKEGNYIPPLGTKIAAGTITSETTSGASATPAAARWEIITGKPRITIDRDNDDQEFPDIGTRRIEHEPGNYKITGTLEMYLEKDVYRYPGAVMGLWDATNLTYSDATFYSKYNIWILMYPDAMTLSATTAETCRKLYNVTFGKDTTTRETGKGTMLSIPFSAEYDEVLMNYTLPVLNLRAATTIADGTFSLTTQPSYPTTILITIVAGDTSVYGTINIDGTDITDDEIQETLDGFGASTLTDTTTISFKTVDATGVTLAGWTSTTGTFTIDAVGGFGT